MHSQISYEKKIADQLNSNPKLFHSYLRNRRVGRPKIGPLKLESGETTDNPLDMAKCFASFFASVFVTDDPQNPAEHQITNLNLPAFLATPEEVARQINSLDKNSSMGPDGIHPRLLRECVQQLSKPLSVIFNNSLISGVLP